MKSDTHLVFPGVFYWEEPYPKTYLHFGAAAGEGYGRQNLEN